MKINYWHSLEYECFYHIFNRSVSDVNLFKNDSDFQFFLNKFKEYCLPYFDLYAYCLIPNHFHFIAKVKSTATIKKITEKEQFLAAQKYNQAEISINDYISNQLKRLFSSYALTYNNKYKRKGPLFQNKVKRIFIQNDDRLRFLIAYVHHNPIHHSFTKNYSGWNYSSFSGLISKSPTNLSREQVMTLFKGQTGFDNFHDTFQWEKKNELNE